MGGCFSRALLTDRDKGSPAEELTFRQQELSLSSRSDGGGVIGESLSDYHSAASNLTVINTINLRRRDSEIIKTAKENLRKFPRKSSLKNTDVEDFLDKDGGSGQGATPMSNGVNGSGSNRDSKQEKGSDASADDLAPTSAPGQQQGDSSSGKDKTPPESLKRNVSFCQEVILIQYYK
mmetsp:Transcript_5977/g.14807  ORF Transcript_5977/g.14807 Transcript_5977/m.14807 type:complete len:178 (+) Transcript_5977:54-587(+)